MKTIQEEILQLSTTEVEAKRDEAVTRLAEINLQLDRAKGQAASAGDYADPDWYARAKAAKRFWGICHQACLFELAKRKKAARAADNKVIERLFVDVARELMEPDFFREVMAEAESRARASGVHQ